MTRLNRWKRPYVVVLFCVTAAIASSAQVFTTLLDFDGTNGANPFFMSLVQGGDGLLYGTTQGDATYPGTIFKISPDGKLINLYTFSGLGPFSGLVLATDGDFYGTADTVFKITQEGSLTTLYQFCCGESGLVYAGLVQGDDGNFYGTTYGGGNDFKDCNVGCGTIFKITPTGTFTTLHSFGFVDGAGPYSTLIQGVDENFYGTTYLGGANDAGTVFKITPTGTFTILHSFDGTNGMEGIQPTAGVAQGADGNFYGTTIYGGASDGGTVFELTSKGDFTTICQFGTEGAHPYGGTLIQATDGNFYGTLSTGGANNWGALVQITPAGTVTAMHSFDMLDGWDPFGGLVQGTDGKIYGATLKGGNLSCEGGDGCGTVFSLEMGLSPFARLVRDSGKVGRTGGILGQGFTGTTDVSLDGTPASFTVFSDTFLKATVPAGATTGFVTVTTPSGTLTSNNVFRVTPQLLGFDPPSGPVGTQVTITGVSLTQTQGVGFGNRVPAQFTVNSDMQVTAIVPGGAKTGKIGIQTKGGTAISAVTFTVTP